MEAQERLLQDAQRRMDGAIAALEREFGTIRTGRASVAMLDRVTVESYGQRMPLNQLATVAVPDARTIIIQPWDKSIIRDVERAVYQAELGLTPTSDGNVIRINVPPLTEERRQEFAKLAKKLAEEGKVAIRRVRGDINKDIKTAEKNGELSEDEAKRLTDKVQTQTDRYVEKVDQMLAAKQKEIMEI